LGLFHFLRDNELCSLRPGTTKGSRILGIVAPELKSCYLVTTEGGMSGGGSGKVPIKDESFKRPTPTSSYEDGVFSIKGTLPMRESELK
jgi:hypothetical protein